MFQFHPPIWKEIRGFLVEMTDSNISWSSFYELWREIDNKVGGADLYREQQKVCEKNHSVNIFIAKLALESERHFSKMQIELSASKKPSVMTFTKEQVACLNALMFFSIYRDLPETSNSSFPKYRNFNSWRHSMLEQWKCLYSYFETLEKRFEEYKNLEVTYMRVFCNRNLEAVLNESENLPLSKYKLEDSKPIEMLKDCYQIDFANKFIGGGITSYGCAQEEIRFAISPELIPSLLFFEKMDDRDAIIAIGAEQYSNYSGYLHSFTYEGEHKDQAETIDNTKLVVVVAIDALNFRQDPSSQYKRGAMDREILKAFTGFNWLDSNFGCKRKKQSKTEEPEKIVKEDPLKKFSGSQMYHGEEKGANSKSQSKVIDQNKKSSVKDSKIRSSSISVGDIDKETKSKILDEKEGKQSNNQDDPAPKADSTIRNTEMPQANSEKNKPVTSTASQIKETNENERTDPSHSKIIGTLPKKEMPDDDPQPQSDDSENEQKPAAEIKDEKKEGNSTCVQLNFWEKQDLHIAIEKMGLATGKWGCGVFKGNEELKFLIQLLSASMSRKEMVFCTFHDKVFADLNEELEMLREKSGEKPIMTCRELYSLLVEVIENLENSWRSPSKGDIFKLFRDAYASRQSSSKL